MNEPAQSATAATGEPANGVAPHAPFPTPIPARRSEIDAKQQIVAGLIAEAQADGLLLFDPANIGWLTGASLCHNLPDPHEWPAIYLTDTQRWLLSSSADTQRIFDLHLDGLGFQLKEWPWQWGREKLLADLVQNRRLACDRVLAESIPFGPTFRRLRLALTPPEADRLRLLGADLAHALEATCRNIEPGQTEQEVAGEIAHRLMKHGVAPVTVDVAADGRPDRHTRPGLSESTIRETCVLSVTAQRNGLHAHASRAVYFRAPTGRETADHDAACRIAAALTAVAGPRISITAVWGAGRDIARQIGREPEWLRGPTGWVTGWLPVERPIEPGVAFALGAGWVVSWNVGINAARVGSTVLLGDMPMSVTDPENWPIKRIHIGGLTLDLPDLFVR